MRLAGGIPVFVDAAEEDGFALRAEVVLAACTDATRLIVLNSPGNPSGAVMARRELERIAGFALERSITILFDECYADFVYDDAEHVTPLALGRDAKAVTVICGSCSKTHAMTGWRIGYVAGPRHIVDAMLKLQTHMTSNATSISQWAALAALTGDPEPQPTHGHDIWRTASCHPASPPCSSGRQLHGAEGCLLRLPERLEAAPWNGAHIERFERTC